jgi:heme-degrading monooxygenase HmoA
VPSREYTFVICRLWHGWTRSADADAYERYLREELFPRLERDVGGHGYREHHVLRRDADDETAFVTLVWFDSLDAVRAFAGDDYELPVLSERARELLLRFDERAVHYELVS